VHITGPNTTFPIILTPGRAAFRLVLGQVDRDIEMVDQYKEGGRPLGLPQSLKLSKSFFMMVEWLIGFVDKHTYVVLRFNIKGGSNLSSLIGCINIVTNTCLTIYTNITIIVGSVL
jgi:hypothetical protein